MSAACSWNALWWMEPNKSATRTGEIAALLDSDGSQAPNLIKNMCQEHSLR